MHIAAGGLFLIGENGAFYQNAGRIRHATYRGRYGLLLLLFPPDGVVKLLFLTRPVGPSNSGTMTQQ